MSSTSPPAPVLARRRDAPPRARTLQKLDNLLSVAASLIARKGFEKTSIRDVGRETGASLPGLYYYFRSKEDLLFQIQHRTFSSLIESQELTLAGGGDAPDKLRRLVIGHLAFVSSHPNEMKVCTFELESLREEAYGRIEELRKRYYRLVRGVVAENLVRSGRADEGGRTARHVTLFVFGMLNWVFMWFDTGRDAPVEKLGDEMTDVVLHGLTGAGR